PPPGTRHTPESPTTRTAKTLEARRPDQSSAHQTATSPAPDSHRYSSPTCPAHHQTWQNEPETEPAHAAHQKHQEPPTTTPARQTPNNATDPTARIGDQSGQHLRVCNRQGPGRHSPLP